MIMSLQVGNQNATTGMSKAIYDKIRDVLEPLEGVEESDMEPIRDGWRNLAFAIATGVIGHLLSNLEVYGIVTEGQVNADVSGNTGTTNSHHHSVNLSAVENNVTFTQNNDGAGRIR